MDYVFGYTVHNDVSGRTLQTGASGTEGSSMTKGMDCFGPTGPYITLKEDVPDPYNLAIETKLNGEVHEMDNANTSFMRHKIPAQLSLISHLMTLEPGGHHRDGRATADGATGSRRHGRDHHRAVGHIAQLRRAARIRAHQRLAGRWGTRRASASGASPARMRRRKRWPWGPTALMRAKLMSGLVAASGFVPLAARPSVRGSVEAQEG